MSPLSNTWRMEQFRGSIHPSSDFDDVIAAESIETSMKSDKSRVIQTLVHACNAQRQMIRTPYKVRYGKDLEEELKKHLSGELEDVAVALMQTPTKLLVAELQKAVKGLGTNEGVLIEILSSRTNEEMEEIRNTYQYNYKRSLEDAVSADTSGDFKRLLLILIQGARDETDHVDSYRATQDANSIVKSSEKKSGVDKFDAYKILCTANPRYIHHLATEYEKMTGSSLDKAIEKEFSGDVRKLFLALFVVSQGKPKFFAQSIYTATKGLGTRDKDLIRILVSRSEIDLDDVASEYQRIYKKSLVELIREECKGSYRDALQAILKGNRNHMH